MEKQYDIIINGGGINGITLALAIQSASKNRLKIAVVERFPLQTHQVGGFDARSIALSDGTCRKLAQISLSNGVNLWQHIKPIIEPIKHIHVSDQGHSGLVEFTATQFHLSQLGCVVELQTIGQMLYQLLAQFPDITLYCPQQIEHIQQTAERVVVQLDNQQKLTALLLVAADGTNSPIATQCGINTQITHDYQQTAIIANVQTSELHRGRAFERFTKNGPLALLPMRNNLLSLVWCVRTIEIERLMSLSDSAFLAQLQQTFGWRLGKFVQMGKRVAYPLRLQQAEKLFSHRLVLIGNAAQTLHPIAGQGFNLGIRDVMTLAEQIAQTAQIGSMQMLNAYAEQRAIDRQKTIALTDNLVSIFANDLLPLQVGRNVALLALSHSTQLKRQFARRTLGWVK